MRRGGCEADGVVFPSSDEEGWMRSRRGGAKDCCQMTFRELLAGNEAHLAPAVFNPLSAKLAEQAGFKMLYLGGGALGYVKCCLEANLNLTEVVQAGVEIRGVTTLPLILDAACGFGD